MPGRHSTREINKEENMDKKRAGIFWGILLIAGGAYTLARTAGFEITQDPTVWAFIFGGISVFSLIFYFADGVKNWGWLFPVGIFGGLAITSGLVARGVDDPAMAAPLFIGIGLPFIVAFFQDRAHNWWALIPAGAMAFLTLVLFVADRVAGEWIGSGMFFILAATFFLVYLSRHALWAAIVAYVLFIFGFMPLMAMTPRPELAGVITFFAIGLPFLFVYLKTPERWWALFPAGILLTLGVVTAVVLIPGVPTEEPNRIGNALFFAGGAATFAVAWLRHHKRWAMVVTILAAILAVITALFGEFQQSWPIILILAGAFMLYTAIRKKPGKTEIREDKGG
jgi:hypothetical protein